MSKQATASAIYHLGSLLKGIPAHWVAKPPEQKTSNPKKFNAPYP
jgi:hypothetical protein